MATGWEVAAGVPACEEMAAAAPAGGGVAAVPAGGASGGAAEPSVDPTAGRGGLEDRAAGALCLRAAGVLERCSTLA